MNNELKIAFFGGEPLGVPALEEMSEAGIVPSLVICNPDRPSGRGMQLQAPPVKQWATENDVAVFQPNSYKQKEELSELTNQEWDLFVVVAYNFILPKWLLELPKHGVINVHPSLLPSLRGASPIRTAILENKREDVGVTIMLMDEKMDHGPILDQISVPIADENWPISGPELDTALARTGGALLAATIPEWVAGEIEPQEQDHNQATYTKRFDKGTNELDLDPLSLPTGSKAIAALHKIQAWAGIGDTFFKHNDVRVKVKTASLAADGSLQIERAVPEGKKEMDFTSYLHSLVS